MIIIDLKNLTFFLRLLQDNNIWQDMKGIVLNYIGVPIHWQDKEIWQDMEYQHHPHHIL